MHDLDRVFPLAGGSPERVPLRAPTLTTLMNNAPSHVMGHRAFMRTWAARRAVGAAATQLPMGDWKAAPHNHGHSAGQQGHATS